ncbi:LysR family transcriptional regulator [Thalassotalea aquiviva]|uniref:LysR family transcriptional regulator n=1 Tax=Thalassotalea aquiviva TaxID=3242415 RepID=UPI00352A1EAA
MLNPIWLNTFKTLIEVGHFTQTAEKLFMTQPGVSQHIKKLEQACGHDLIRRENKSFELTEQGRLVYDYAITLQQGQQDLLTALNFDDPFAGSCKISCSGSLVLKLYPKLLNLQCQHPQLIINMEAAPNRHIIKEVQDGETDVGIVTHLANPSQFEVTILGVETLCLVLPADREWDLDSADFLTTLGLINHPDGHYYLSMYFAQCGNKGFSELNLDDIPITGYVNQISQILLPVSKGLGFSVLPKSAVECFIERETLSVFEAKKSVTETLYLIHKRNRELPKRFDTVIDLIKQQIK